MPEIIAILEVLSPRLSAKTLKHLRLNSRVCAINDRACHDAKYFSVEGKPDRPKGSKNKNRREVKLSVFQLQLQLQLQPCIRQALVLVGSTLKIGHFIYDGALGNNAGLQTVNTTQVVFGLQIAP